MTDQASIPDLMDEYISTVNDSLKYAYLVRAAELQQERVKVLIKLKNRIKGFKNGAVKAQDERAANALFHLQSGLNAYASELRMFIALKNEDLYDAWDLLIDAQEYVSYALRAGEIDVGIDNLKERLTLEENLIFPGYPRYNSYEAVIKGGICTICNSPFIECDHMEELVYWGKLCLRVHPDLVSFDSIALVEDPKDRRCIITELTNEEGDYIDYMTWRLTGEEVDEGLEENVLMRLKCRVFQNKLLEID